MSARTPFLLFLVVSFLLAASVQAKPSRPPPLIVTHQLRILDANRRPVGDEGGVEMCFKFSLYDDSDPALPENQLWPAGEPEPLKLKIKKGIINAYFGQGKDKLTAEIFDNQEIFVNTTLAHLPQSGDCDEATDFEVIAPRPRLAAAPYALNSASVSGYAASDNPQAGEIPVLDDNGDLVLDGTLKPGKPVGPTYGGTGFNSYLKGDLLYAGNLNTLARLPAGAQGQVLTVDSGAPAWKTATGGNLSGGGTVGRIAKFIAGTILGNSLLEETTAGNINLRFPANLLLSGITRLTRDGAAFLNNLFVGNNTILGDASSDILTINSRLASDLVPDINNGRILGLASRRFGNVYTTQLDVSSRAGIGTSLPTTPLHVVGDTTLEGNLLPLPTDSRDVGSASQRWRDAYFSGQLRVGNTVTLGGDHLTFNTPSLSFRDADSNDLFQIVDNGTRGNLKIAGIEYAFPARPPAAGQVLTAAAGNTLDWVNPAVSGIGGSGTAGHLPKFSDSSTLADSLLKEDSGSIVTSGDFLPATNLIYRIGNGLKKFAEGHFGIVRIGTTSVQIDGQSLKFGAKDGFAVGADGRPPALAFKDDGRDGTKIGINQPDNWQPKFEDAALTVGNTTNKNSASAIVAGSYNKPAIVAKSINSNALEVTSGKKTALVLRSGGGDLIDASKGDGKNAATIFKVSGAGNIAFGGDILPTNNEIYDIGSPTKRVKDLFVGSGSIHLGPLVFSAVDDKTVEIANPKTGKKRRIALDALDEGALPADLVEELEDLKNQVKEIQSIRVDALIDLKEAITALKQQISGNSTKSSSSPPPPPPSPTPPPSASSDGGTGKSGSQGPNNPGTVVSDSSCGGTVWVSPASAGSSNNAYTTVNPSLKSSSQCLKAAGFSFSVPGGATIDGIVVKIERKSTNPPSSYKDYSVRLVKNGILVGDNKADTATFWPTADTDRSYGSSTDLWSTNWTASDINDSNFGMALVVSHESAIESIAQVDGLEITVYYTTASASVLDNLQLLVTDLLKFLKLGLLKD